MKKFKMNTIAAVAVTTMLSFAVAAPASASGGSSRYDRHQNTYINSNTHSNQAQDVKLTDLENEINRVDDEDMRVKSGAVSGNTMTLRVEDERATGTRTEPFGRNVNIDVTGLNQSDEVATNATNINTNKDRIEQVDQEDHRAVAGSYDSGKLTINTQDMDGGSKRTFEVTGFDTASNTNKTKIDINSARIEQVNLEDQRLKDGEVNAAGDLVLYTEDQPAGQSRRAVTVDGFKTNVTDKIGSNSSGITTNTTNISTVDNRVTSNRTDINTNTTNISTVDNRVTSNRTDINTNTDNISTVDNRVTSNRTDINTNTTNISTVDNRVTSNRTDINTNTTNISTVDNRVTSNRTDINTNTDNIKTHSELLDELLSLNANSVADDATMNQRIDNAMSNMRYMDRNLSAGIASSMAIGQHQFDPSFKGGQVSLAGGFYNGQNAVSFAVGVPVGENAFFSASIATDSGSYGESGAVGITYRLQ